MGWSRGGKDTTDDFSRIDVRYLSRNGILRPGSSSTIRWTRGGNDSGAVGVRSTFDSVVLKYRRKPPGSDEWISEQYPIYLDWSPCNYGGKRPWFLCPARGCGRRAAVLYGGGIFACRQCHQLVYESQREQSHYRALRRFQAILMKLGGSGSTAETFPDKPKGMHWRTYERLAEKARVVETQSWPPWLLRQIALRPYRK
jgi:hypothetical protein